MDPGHLMDILVARSHSGDQVESELKDDATALVTRCQGSLHALSAKEYSGVSFVESDPGNSSIARGLTGTPRSYTHLEQ